jgi:hypothetical protein|tara:strand:+ start:1099 stop:1263 length:165 start_codon:yes stop_codon:yes gene_type:complete
MSKKSDTVKETTYVYTHITKILFEKFGWDKFPLVSKDSIIETTWEGQPVKHLKI